MGDFGSSRLAAARIFTAGSCSRDRCHGDDMRAAGAAAGATSTDAPPPPSALPQHRLRQQVGARAIDRGTSNAYVRDGGTSAEVIGSLVGLDADIHLRRYTQITQRHQLRGGWTGRQKSEQLKRLKYFYADPLTPRGELDPHRFLGQRVADTFEKDNHTT